MKSLKYDRVLDVSALECPLPVVKSREEIGRMAVGEVLKVQAMDRDSLRNFQGWANTSKNILLVAQAIDCENGVAHFTHYIRKVF